MERSCLNPYKVVALKPIDHPEAAETSPRYEPHKDHADKPLDEYGSENRGKDSDRPTVLATVALDKLEKAAFAGGPSACRARLSLPG